MKRRKLYGPARAGLTIPMPDRGNRSLPVSGAAIDLTQPYYRRLFDDGDIAEVKPATDKPAKRGEPKSK